MLKSVVDVEPVLVNKSGSFEDSDRAAVLG